jgi:membrane protein implicated in regulation of membrane protease activity
MGGYITLWIFIGIITLILDILTSSFLFVWFTIGSISAIIALVLGHPFSVQVITFTAVSSLFLAVGYPLVKKTIKKTVKRTPTMEETYIGRVLTVDDDVIDKAVVKFDGIYWTIKNEDRTIKKGDSVRITGIEGNKLVVKKI